MEEKMIESRIESYPLEDFLEPFDLRCFTPMVDTEDIKVTTRELLRPGFQLTGWFENFPYQRPLIIGTVENNYIIQMEPGRRKEIFDKIFSYKSPCMIFCRGFEPDTLTIESAEKYGVPLYGTYMETSPFMGQLITELGEIFASFTTMHGVLVDCYGEGILITGESGIGKSETALELIQRGHRLVADDLVEIRRISEKTLVGSAPEVTRYLLEARGIGIIDVKKLFGVESIKEKQAIDLVIHLKEWDKEEDLSFGWG